MRNLRLVIVALLLFVTCYVKIGEGIKCYVCNSETNENCGSGEIDANYSIKCPPKEDKPAILCRKIHQQLKFKEKTYKLIRECGYQKGTQSCYFFKQHTIAYQEMCECYMDNCNHGRRHSPDILMIVVMFFLWFSS